MAIYNLWKRRRILKRINFLDLTPVRQVEATEHGNDLVMLIIPKFRKKWLSDFMIAPAKKKNFHVRLDLLGSTVWRNIDGVANVEEITTRTAGKHPELFESGEDVFARVTKFLTILYEQRYIIFREIEK